MNEEEIILIWFIIVVICITIFICKTLNANKQTIEIIVLLEFVLSTLIIFSDIFWALILIWPMPTMFLISKILENKK